MRNVSDTVSELLVLLETDVAISAKSTSVQNRIDGSDACRKKFALSMT